MERNITYKNVKPLQYGPVIMAQRSRRDPRAGRICYAL